MPIKDLNQVALPQAKAELERLKFNVVSAMRMWAHVSRVLVFSFKPHIHKYLTSPVGVAKHLKRAHTKGPFQGH